MRKLILFSECIHSNTLDTLLWEYCGSMKALSKNLLSLGQCNPYKRMYFCLCLSRSLGIVPNKKKNHEIVLAVFAGCFSKGQSMKLAWL